MSLTSRLGPPGRPRLDELFGSWKHPFRSLADRLPCDVHDTTQEHVRSAYLGRPSDGQRAFTILVRAGRSG
jgi:hypothetical protein